MIQGSSIATVKAKAAVQRRVWDSLKTHPEFEMDQSIPHQLLITVAPDGYLRRPRHGFNRLREESESLRREIESGAGGGADCGGGLGAGGALAGADSDGEPPGRAV